MMDDVFVEELPDDEDTVRDANMEWRKKKVKEDAGTMGEVEMESRRIDRKKAAEHDAKQKTAVNSKLGSNPQPIKIMPTGLKKVKKKIRQDAYGYEEEDENDYQTVGTMGDNSLLLALNMEEQKRLADRKKQMETDRQLQHTGRIGTAREAAFVAKQAGVKLKESDKAKHTGDATYSRASMEKALAKDVSKKLGIHAGKISASRHKDLSKGVKKIREKGGRVEGMKVDDVAKAASANDKGVAEIIYSTASKGDKKIIHQKTEARAVIQKSGRIEERPKAKSQEKDAIREIERGNVRVQGMQNTRHR